MLLGMSTSPPPSTAKVAAERRNGPFRGIQGVILTITLSASLAVLALPFLRPDGGRRSPLQIVVAEPEILGRDARLDPREHQLRVEAVRDGLERQLHGRQGLKVVRFFVPQLRALELARQLGADEILSPRLRSAPFGVRLGLSRQRTIDGIIVWQRDEVQLAAEDLRFVDRALGEQLQLAFIRYERPPAAVQLYAEAADYEAFLRLRLEARASGDWRQLLPRLEALRRGSPRFFEAYFWPARWLAKAPEKTPEEVAKALMLLEQSKQIAPADSRSFELAFHLLLESGRREEAEQQLTQLEKLLPGDPSLVSWRSLLGEESAKGALLDQRERLP